MKSEQLKNLDAVAETLLIPLCYRAVEARRQDPLVRDPRAQEIIDQLGVDPAHLKLRPFQHVFAMLRARQYDRWARAFLANHPNPVVVEIGCGLDARFVRLDYGTGRWVDMDLPEVISLRRRFFTDTGRRQMLAHSVFNLDWMDCIPSAGNYLFIAEGVFPYFNEDEVRPVFIALAERFSGSEMIVDALSPFMVHASAINPSFRGYQVRPRWSVSDPRSIETWYSGIEVLETYTYFGQPEPRLANVWWMAKTPLLRNIARVLHLRMGQ